MSNSGKPMLPDGHPYLAEYYRSLNPEYAARSLELTRRSTERQNERWREANRMSDKINTEKEERLAEIMSILLDGDFGRFYTVEQGNSLVREANELRKALGREPLDPARYGDGK